MRAKESRCRSTKKGKLNESCMKTNDKTRRFTNPEFDGTAATPRSRLLHYSKARLTRPHYSRVRHCWSSVLDPELRHTPLHPTSPVGPTCPGSPNLMTTIPTRIRSYEIQTHPCDPSPLRHSYTSTSIPSSTALAPHRPATCPCHCHCHIPTTLCCLSHMIRTPRSRPQD